MQSQGESAPPSCLSNELRGRQAQSAKLEQSMMIPNKQLKIFHGVTMKIAKQTHGSHCMLKGGMHLLSSLFSVPYLFGLGLNSGIWGEEQQWSELLAANRGNSLSLPTSSSRKMNTRGAECADRASPWAGIAAKPRSNTAKDLFQSLQSWWERKSTCWGAGGIS